MKQKYHDLVSQAVSASGVAAEPTVTIAAFKKLGKDKARVTIDVNHNAASRENAASVFTALAKTLDGKMAAVAGTFRSVDKTRFVERLTGIVALSKSIVTVDESKTLEGFKCVASNMFMDDENDMWQLHTTANGKILVKTSGIDDELNMMNLLQSCSSAGAQVGAAFRSLSSYETAKPRGGQFVTYIGADNSLRAGFVVASVQDATSTVVQPVDGEEPEEIDDDAVVDTLDEDALPKDEPTEEDKAEASVSAARGSVSIQQISAYYKRVYGRHPKFYNDLMARLRSHQFAG